MAGRGRSGPGQPAWSAAGSASPRCQGTDLERLLDRGVAGQALPDHDEPVQLRSARRRPCTDGARASLDRPRASLRSIELSTDGYFAPGATADLAAWEAAFAEVDAVVDPEIGRYASVKGSTAEAWTDDRTVVIVHL